MTINLRAGAGAIAYVAGVLFTHAPLSSGLLIAQAVFFGLAIPFEVLAINGLVNAVVEGSGAAVEPWAAVLPWLGLLAVAFAMRSLESAARRYVAVLVQEQIEPVLRRQLFEKAISVPLETFERPAYYQKLETGSQALGDRIAGNLRSVIWLIGAFSGAVGLFILYVAAHWLLAAFLVAVALVVSILRGRAAAKFAQVYYHGSPLRREAGYWSDLLSSRETGPELRLFGLAGHLIALWRGVFDRHVAEMDRGRRQTAIQYLTEAVVSQTAIVISGITLVILASTDQINIGQLVALLYALSQFESVTNTLGWSSASLIREWTTITHLRDFLALDSERRSLNQGAKRLPTPFRQDIQFDDVGFTYPGTERPALSGINLTIRPNEHVALVGENGAGKTTLVRLLLGLYRPTEGRIMVDGVDVADLDPDEWRQRATAIFQDFVRYPTTPFENIAFADPSLLGDEATRRSLCIPGSSRRPLRPALTRSSTHCPSSTPRRSARSGRAASSCRLDSGSGWRLAERICATPRSLRSTNPPPHWIRAPRPRSTTISTERRPAGPPSSYPIAWARPEWRTGSSSFAKA